MNYEEHKEYILGTVNQMSKYIQKEILKTLVEKEVIINHNKQINNNNCLDVRMFQDEEKLKKSIELSDKAMKAMEKWEFTKSYRYSAIFTYDEIKEENIQNLLNQNKAFNFTDSTNEFDKIMYVADNPTIYREDKLIIFKFNMLNRAIHPQSGELLKIKYPVLAVFFVEHNVLEIRFDTISDLFRTDKYFYKKIINGVKSWIGSRLNTTVSNINFRPIIKNIVSNKKEEVTVDSQYMALQRGGKAILEVGGNQEYVLPILGELKILMKKYKEEFDKAKEVKKILEDFILVTEETSDLPWISLCWKEEDITVKFTHDYMKEQYSILYYYGSLENMERMNYVTKYLIENQKMD